MQNIQERIATLEDKLRQLKARQQRLEIRRKRIEGQQERKAETRRKILVGAIILGKAERGEISDTQLRKWLDEALTRSDDRRLFGLV